MELVTGNVPARERGRPIAPFLVLLTALAVPFWLAGAVAGLELLPGLPLAALWAVCPAIAAVLLVHRDGGRAAVAAFLRRSFALRSRAWLVPALLLEPAVMALSFAALRLSGVPVPAPRVAVLQVALLCALFFVGAMGEEIGWSGYLTDPLRARWGVLGAGVVLGAIWAGYHLVPLAQAHRGASWIGWWSLGTVALRVVMVWLYVNGGRSVLLAGILHTTTNVTWQLFPVAGSFYDPRITGLITALVAAIILVWELRRRRAGEPTPGDRRGLRRFGIST